jgi:hypothetical protein
MTLTNPFPEGANGASAVQFPFTAVDLTDSIDVLGNQWGVLGDSGMFPEEGWDSNIVEIDYRDGFIGLLGEAERGTVPTADGGDRETGVLIKIPHFPTMDNVTPKDLENRFAFTPGSRMPRRRRTLEDVLVHKLAKIRLKHDVTKEYLRVGAVKGKIYDGKNKLLYDLFSTFGITQQVFNFEFSDDTFAVREYTYQVADYIELNLHGDVSTGIDAMVSPEFFDALTAHPEVKGFFLQNPTAREFQGDLRKNFEFGAIRFWRYNAQAPTAPLDGILQQQTQGMGGVQRFVEAEAGYAYPAGTRDTFRHYNAPAYAIPQIYQEGVPLFVSPKILDHGHGVELLSQSNPLPFCRKPSVLAKLTMS